MSTFASSYADFRFLVQYISHLKISITLLTCLILFKSSLHDMAYNTLVQNKLSLRTVKICGESLHMLQQHELPGKLLRKNLP